MLDRTDIVSGEKEKKMGKPISASEMHQKIVVMKEEIFRNGFCKTTDVEEFFQEYWMEILDMLDDALYAYLHNEKLR